LLSNLLPIEPPHLLPLPHLRTPSL
jgi:hypothetical protein